MSKKDLKAKIREELRADQAAYDERTRRLEEYLRRAGIPTGADRASYEVRTRLLEEALARYERRLASS